MLSREVGTITQPSITILMREINQAYENCLSHIYFRFSNTSSINSTLEPLTGFIAAEVFAANDTTKLSDINTDWPVIDLKPGEFIYGVVSVIMPKAGIDRKLNLFFYEKKIEFSEFQLNRSPKIYESGFYSIHVAAALTYELAEFNVIHKRAKYNDSPFATLSLYASGRPVPMVCGKHLTDTGAVYYNDVQNGIHSFFDHGFAGDGEPAYLKTNEFAMIPGDGSNVWGTFGVYNYGSNGEAETRTFLNALSTAGASVANSLYSTNGESWKGVDTFHQMLNADMTEGCNGRVAVDQIALKNDWVFTQLDQQESVSIKGNYSGPDYESQIGCGKTPEYEITGILRRIKHEGPYDCEKLYSLVVTNNKTIKYNPKQEVFWSNIQTINEDKIINVNDPKYGSIQNNNYISPDIIDHPTLIILKGFIKNSSDIIGEQPKDALTFIHLANKTVVVGDPHILVDETKKKESFGAKIGRNLGT